MLKKNCNKVFGSLKSKLTVLEQVFQTAGVINPPPASGIGLKHLLGYFRVQMICSSPLPSEF